MARGASSSGIINSGVGTAACLQVGSGFKEGIELGRFV